MNTISQTREVSMSAKKRKEKMRVMVELKTEARMLAEGISTSQKCFFKPGTILQKELEPGGPMAGFRI